MSRNKFEKQFEVTIRGILREAGIPTCKLLFRVNKGLTLGGHLCAYPDICINGIDGHTLIAIECKIAGDLQSMTQAIGQAMLYKKHSRAAMICLPTYADNQICCDVMDICDEQDITICTEKNIVARVRRALGLPDPEGERRTRDLAGLNGEAAQRLALGYSTLADGTQLAGPLPRPCRSGSMKCLILPEIESAALYADGR